MSIFYLLSPADTLMLGAFGTSAGERTLPHFRKLLADAGLQLVRVQRTRSHYSVLEAMPANCPVTAAAAKKKENDPIPSA
jgi:hypothetical protein